MVDRTTNVLWFLSLAMLILFSFRLILGQETQPKNNNEWIEMDHENGGIYVIRKQHIIGCYIPPNGSLLKHQIMYQGSAVNSSDKFTVEEFLEKMK